jgi:putative ABC transport system permease protein
MWRRKKRERDLERELRSDLELEASEQQERGLSPEEARYAAQRALGNSMLIKEEVRKMWGWNRWEIVIQDLRYALRMLRKSPGFAVTAILTLALGIGASTAVFTAVDSVVLKPLGYRDSGSLVALWENLPFNSFVPVGPNLRHADLWQKRAAFSGVTFVRQGASGVTLGTDHPRLVGTVTATPNLFEILQATPLLGRGFVPEDGVKGHDNVVILSYAGWQSLFQGDLSVIGKTVRFADAPREVIGVLPAGFHFPNANSLHAFRSKQLTSSAPEPAIFLPAVLDLAQFSWNGDYGNWIAIARLKPGFSVSQAEAQLTSIQAQIFQEIPAREKNDQLAKMRAYVQPMQEAIVGDAKTGLWLLMSAVLGLMLIACVNLASAQLGRTLSRQREAAVRTALGAAKWRLVWSSLAENLVLAAVGGAAGIALAAEGLDLFRHYSPLDLPRLSEVHINRTVLLFSLALTLCSSLLFGVLPALKLLHTDPQASLQKSNSRSLGHRQSHRLRAWLIAAQVFGCTVLLLVTGLFLKSFLYLLHQDKGFETGQVVVAEVNLPRTGYGADQKRIAFDDAVLENLRAIPGVQSAGFVSSMPLEGEAWIEGIQRVDLPSRQAAINLRWVSPGYFETTRQKLIAGRFLEELDRSGSSAVLSEGLAKSVWQNENPIGGQFIVEGRTFTVTGIVADSRNASLKSPPPRMVYLHYKDRPPFTTVFMARSAAPADTLASGMRQAIWKYAPDITIARVKTLDSQLTDSLATERFQTSALMSFGIAALLLAMLGIYGVLSYSTVTRRQEIGMRMALGASRRGIYTLIVGEASIPVFVGLGAGLIASIAAGRVIQKLLYGTQAIDASVILVVAALFLSAAVAAAFLPARRAASVDPMEALRSE